MNRVKTVIVDDEESARDILENLLKRFCPQIELIGKYRDLPEAVSGIKQHKTDIVFLDIEMPNYAGYEIVDFFDDVDFEMIFVSAYDKYAIRAFEVAAFDYLLKPVDIERLKLTVARAVNQVGLKQNAERINLLSNTLKEKEVSSIIISDKGMRKILPVNSIIAVEAQESYSCVHTVDKQYVVSKNLKHYETIFSETSSFFRVHKSWIINKSHIRDYSKSDLQINLTNSITAKLSKYKKAEFEKSLLN